MRPALLALAVLLAACDTVDGGSPDFGDPYTVQSVALDGRGLTAVVTYSGGCEAHGFVPRARTRSGAVELWLEHDANGDMCEALVRDTVRASVTTGAIDGVVFLTPPDGEVRLR